MADRKPLKVLPDGGGDSTGLSEFRTGDTIGVANGGTGLTTVATSNILTGNGASALSAEANLTFDGTSLAIGNGASADYLALRLYQGGGTTYYWDFTSDVDAGDLIIGSNHASFDLILNPSYGNVGIGETTPLGKLHVKTADSGWTPNTSADELMIENSGDAGMTIGSGSSSLGMLMFADSEAASGQIYYSHASNFLATVVNGAERMRIDSAGKVGIGGTPTVPFHIFSAVTGDVVQWENTNTGGSFLRFRYNGVTPDNNTVHFLHGSDGTANRVYIYSDGDLANHDGAYGTISDVKLKQDIEDVRSYWDDFKQLQYRKFRHKTDVEANADAPYRLGLVAQEVETIFPALVPESPDPDIETEEAVVDEDGEAVLDEDGNPTYETISTPSGTTHKWIKSSIIEGPIMGSVVQELQTRLEAAEAKITALESA
jgi:hypothetical protein